MAEGALAVEVVYAAGGQVWSRRVQLPSGSRVEAAIEASGVREAFAELRGADLDVGVFNKPRSLADGVRDGDRVEIYRPLTIDPKEARRIRAEVRRRRKGAAA